jgi:hypothetical protein
MDEVQKASDSDKSHRSHKCYYSYFPLRTAFNELIDEFFYGALLVLVCSSKQKQNILCIFALHLRVNIVSSKVPVSHMYEYMGS